MRVGISGYFLDKPMTGSGQYLLGLAGEIPNVDPSDDFLLLQPDGYAAKLPVLTGFDPKQVGMKDGGNLGKVIWEHLKVPSLCRRERIELLHVPYFGSPMFPSCRTVVTIHDLIMMVLPQHRGSALVRAYTYVAGIAAKRAKMIIADSECTKKDIVRLFNIDAEKIQVVYLACDDRFKPVVDEETIRRLRQRYALDGRFVLYMGGLDWRKNVSTLIRSFANVQEDIILAIAGKALSNSDLYPDLEHIAREAGVKDKVRFLGFVDEEDKPALYSTADAFVFPSLYEGFGLTPLEAMACGTPVICSNASSLPEVVGEAGLLFDPEDEGQLSRLLARVISDEDLARQLSRQGLQRAKSFSWRKTAEETVAVYRKALSL